MNKKINLILAAFLFGGVATVLPVLLKICLFVGAGLLLFVKYDEWAYSCDHRQVGGAE